MSLFCQQFYFIISCQAIDLIQVCMFLDDFECLSTYRPRRAENCDLSFHNSKMPSGKLIAI